MDDLNFKNFKKLSFKNLSKIKFKNINRKKKTIENLYIMSPYVLGTIGRTIVSSIFIILFFYFAPIFLNFTNEKIFISGEFKNNSRKILTYELTGQKSPEVENEKINEKDLLSDILRLNDLETDTVRLSASTIQQLFKDTNYNLADIRKNKLVRPVALTWLPKEIRMIESTKKRKDLFIQIVLPLILQENNNIKLDRLKLFSIIKKSNNSALEKKWLSKKI